MHYSYDDEVDVLDIRLREGKIVESDEIEPGFIVDYDSNGQMLAVEILHASSLLDGGRKSAVVLSPIASDQRNRILRALSSGKSPSEIVQSERDLSIADIQNCLRLELRKFSNASSARVS